MHIAVTTPTGHVGSRVLRLLLQAGVRPTLLLRDPSHLDPGVGEHVELRVGDQTDPVFLRDATEGVDALFWVDPTDHAAEDPVAESKRIGLDVADAVAANGIGRTVFVSSVGAERRHGAGHIDGLAGIERLLDASGGDVVHLRCGCFFTNLLADLDGLREGTLAALRPVDEPVPWVDPRDVGDVAAARLLSPSWSGRVVQGVHGPQDLSYADVAGILGDAVGRPITPVRVPDEDVVEGLLDAGATREAADGVVGMSSGTRGDFEPEQRRTVLTTTPTPLAAWAWSQLRPALAA